MSRIHRPLPGAFCIFAGILSAMSLVVGAEGYVGMSAAPAASTME